jgi:DNA-binding transcriptional regulator YiaG
MVYIIFMTPSDLKAWRKQNGYSQSQLAKVLGVATMTVSRWETGLREIPSFLHLALECLRAKGGEMKGIKGMVTKTKKKRR